MNMARKFTAIGALSLDSIRFYDGRVHRDTFGGSAGYAAVGASFFTDVSMISNVGGDYPAEFLANLGKRGIDTSGIRKLDEEKSTRFSITYDEELTEVEGTTIEMNALSFGIRLPDDISDSRFIYIAGNDPDMQLELLGKIGKGPTIAVSTHMHWIRESPELVNEVIGKSDMVFINSKEICALTGKKQLRNAGMSLIDHGVSLVVVKKGEHGAVLFRKDRIYPVISYDGFDMEYADPTGCGGVLAGAFLGFLAKNEVMTEPLDNAYFKALAFGLVVRSFKLEDVSIEQLLTLQNDEIWRRYDRFRDMLTL